MSTSPVIRVWADFTQGPPGTPNAATRVELTAAMALTELSIKRGRQYEIGHAEAGTCHLTFKDPTELLNPSNPASPYNSGGNTIQPYRAIQITATWAGTTYPIFTGYVERYPSQWENAGFHGLRQLVAVDALAVFARTKVTQSYYATVMADNPVAFAGMNSPEPPAISLTGVHGGVPLLGLPYFYAAALEADGAACSYAGDQMPDQTTPAITLSSSYPTNSTTTPGALTAVTECGNGGAQMPWMVSTSVGVTVEQWAKWTTGACSFGMVQRVSGSTPDSLGHLPACFPAGTDYSLGFFSDGSALRFQVCAATGTPAYYAVPQMPYPDGQFHYLAYTLAPTPGDTSHYSITITVDGVDVTYNTGLAHFAFTPNSAAHNHATSSYTISYFVSNYSGTGYPSECSVGPFAAYSGALPAARRAAHYQRGACNLGESSGGRVTRLLSALWPGGATRVSTGEATTDSDATYGIVSMPGSPKTDSTGTVTALLQVLQDVEDAESGFLFAAADGTVVFESRADRVLRATSGTFGDRPSTGGELPYVDVAFDFDPTRVYNQVDLQRSSSDAQTLTLATSSTLLGVGAYLDLSTTLNVGDDWQLSQAAAAFLARYGTTRQRISKLLLDPASAPALWPMLLALELSTRVGHVRRTSAGVVMNPAGGYFVESIDMHWQATGPACSVALEMSLATTPTPLIIGQTPLASGAVVY